MENLLKNFNDLSVLPKNIWLISLKESQEKNKQMEALLEIPGYEIIFDNRVVESSFLGTSYQLENYIRQNLNLLSNENLSICNDIYVPEPEFLSYEKNNVKDMGTFSKVSASLIVHCSLFSQ